MVDRRFSLYADTDALIANGAVIMNRLNVADAANDLRRVLRQVTALGGSVALEESDRIVAWLTPSGVDRPFLVSDLEQLLTSLPSLGDDLETFAAELESSAAALPTEGSRWD